MSTTMKQTHTPATAPSRGPWLTIAAVLALVGLVSTVVAAVMRGGAGEVLLGVGFLVLIVAWLVAAVGWVIGRGKRFSVIPHTGAGWTALGLLVLGWLATWVPGNIVVQGREANDLLSMVVWGGFGLMFAAGVLVLVAMWRWAERSVPLILLGVFALLFGPFFLLGELILPH